MTRWLGFLAFAFAGCATRLLDGSNLTPDGAVPPDGAPHTDDLASSGPPGCAPLMVPPDEDLCAGAPTDSPRMKAPRPPALPLDTQAPSSCQPAGRRLAPLWTVAHAVPSELDAFGYGVPLVDGAGVASLAQYFAPRGQYLLLDASGHTLSSVAPGDLQFVAGGAWVDYDASAATVRARSSTGQVAWQTSVAALFGSSAPDWPGMLVGASSPDATLGLFIGPAKGGVRAFALELATGQLAFSRPLPSWDALAADRGGFYFNAKTASGRCLVALDRCGAIRWTRALTGNDDFHRWDVAVADGALIGFDTLARRTSDGSAFATEALAGAVFSGSVAYGYEISGAIETLDAVDLAQDRVLWRRFAPAGTKFWDGPVLLADGAVLVPTVPDAFDATTTLYVLGPDGSTRWSCDLQGLSVPSLTVDGERLLVTDGDSLAAYAPTGLPALAAHGWVTAGGDVVGGLHPR